MARHCTNLSRLAALTLLAACAAEDSLRSSECNVYDVDVMTQNVAAQIDVLWVIDNSGSMLEEQDALGASFQSFIGTLADSDVDYHIGVISTDPADGGVLNGTNPIISRTTTNPQQVFLNNVKVSNDCNAGACRQTGGACTSIAQCPQGSRAEEGFTTTAMALGVGPGWMPSQAPSPPSANAGFLRPNASLFIIMVSDEDDKSFGPVGYYARLFESIKGAGNEGIISISAIISEPDPAGAEIDPCGDAAQVGRRYDELTARTGGITASICDNFAASLESLSITAAGLETVFELSREPDLRADVEWKAGCEHGNEGETVATGPLCVMVNGALQPESAWDYEATDDVSGRQHFIEFVGEPPPPEASISVAYRVATPTADECVASRNAN